ncbi:MAG TPA: YciI family protein [Polyangiaceae bacterium]
MQYLLLIYAEEKKIASMPEAELGKFIAEFNAFTKSVQESGHFVANGRLQATANATTVRVREGKTLTTHGPFAETREQLGGFYLVEAKDLDEALALAARIPGARVGSIEVRPMYVVPGGAR